MEIFGFFMQYQEIWKCLSMALSIVGVSKEKYVKDTQAWFLTSMKASK